LVEQIVRDTGSGSLPLLQFTLTWLWETQRRKTLSYVGYHTIGGVSGALDRFAEKQMSKLADDAVGVVDRVLLRVVHTPAGDPGLTTRQRATSPAAGEVCPVDAARRRFPQGAILDPVVARAAAHTDGHG
jgi:hypothetical protein